MPKDYARNRNRNSSGSGNQRGKRNGSGSQRNRNTRARGNTRNRKGPPPKQPTPGWVWMLCGLVIGVLIATGGYIYTQPRGKNAGRARESAATATHKNTAQAKHSGHQTATHAAKKNKLPPKSKPRFSFYDMLPNYEVVIPQKKYRTEQQKKQPEVSKPGRYVIQVGSFRKYAAADSLKARLALLGLESSIHKTDLNDDQTWYRVRIGPKKKLKKINQTLKRLNDHGIDSLVMRVKG